MQLSQILQFLISGISVGSVYALTALGFTIIYNSTNIINFAQGEFVMLGGMSAVFAYKVLGLPLWLACSAAIIAVTLVGIIFERLAIYPQRDAPVVSLIIITIGGSILFRGGAMQVFGQDPQALPAFTTRAPLEVAGAVIPFQALWVLGITFIVLIAQWVFYRHTLLGKAMRACADNREGALIVGVKVSSLIMYSFAFSAALGAVGGIVITPMVMTAFNVGGIIGLKGFSAAIVGGLGSPIGSVLGGLFIGVVESLSIGFISSGYKDVISLLILLAVLFFKPQGLFGGSSREKV